MYQEKENTDQMEFVGFHLKFGGELNPRNRWVRLSRLIPWEKFESEYAKHFPSKTKNPANPFRMALGALLIKEMQNLTDKELVEDIRGIATITICWVGELPGRGSFRGINPCSFS